ncbi:MAG TPA: hypothetical protein VND91_02090, partial [Candidatus Saccharimonadia bacterium]|nr:hypothetical protein [Candidatus Saccharimonadia bacterium]
ISLGLLRCGNRTCSNGNTFTTVDNAFSETGLANALALGADGMPVIAYSHSTNGALRVAKCASAACQ